MRILNLRLTLLVLLLITVSSLSNNFIVSAAGAPVSGNQSAAAVLANKGQNILKKLGEECKNLDNWSDGNCDAYQSIMTNQLNCGDGKMFQKAEIQTDPQDSSVTKTKWFVDPNRYSECLKKAVGFVTAIKDADTPPDCKSMSRVGKTDDDPKSNWKKCEQLQDKLFSSLGCSKKMFTNIPGDENHDTFKPDVVDACLNSNIKSASSITLAGPDGQKATFSNDGEIAKIVDKDGNDITDQVKSASASDATDDTDSNCSGGPMGWLFCPMIEYMANTINAIAGIIDSLMQVRFMAAEGPVAQIEKGWRTFLSFANIMLVIAFLVIIFSQATQAGLSNYNVKRMLPRLVLAAILMNISFYLCALLIDISNIVGASVMGLFIGGDSSISSSIGEITNDGGGGLLGGIGAVTAAATLIGILMFVLPFVLLSIVGVFVMLIGRQVVLMCLILVSSLAFVAWLLPNTEQYFQKWWKLFTQLLLVYPMIMLVFGASLYLSNLLGSDAGVSVVAGESDTLRKLVQLIILMIPIFAIPGLLKGSSAIMGRISGAADNVSRQIKLDKVAEGTQKRARNYTRMAGVGAVGAAGSGWGKIRNSDGMQDAFGEPKPGKRRIRRAVRAVGDLDRAVNMAADFRKQGKEADRQKRALGMLASKDEESGQYNPTLIGRFAGEGGVNRATAQISSDRKEAIDRLKGEWELGYTSIGAIGNALRQAMKDGDEVKIEAAIGRLSQMGVGGVEEVYNALSSSGSVSSQSQTAVNRAVGDNANYGAFVAASGDIAKGSFQGGAWSGGDLGSLGTSQLATQSSAALGRYSKQIKDLQSQVASGIKADGTAFSTTELQEANARISKAKAEAVTIVGNAQLSSQIRDGESRAALENMAKGTF